MTLLGCPFLTKTKREAFMKKKKSENTWIEEPYESGYRLASNGKWEYYEYFKLSHLERRKAYPARRKRGYAPEPEPTV